MPGVSFERLPPERLSVAPAAASAGSCCCCCCCCLHTIGSVVGALTARAPKVDPTTELPTASVGTLVGEPRYSVGGEYWRAVLLLSILVFPLVMVGVLNDHERYSAGTWLLLYAIFFPGIQLAASLAVLVKTSASKRPGQEMRLRHLGRITLRMFVGGAIGFGVMWIMFVLR